MEKIHAKPNWMSLMAIYVHNIIQIRGIRDFQFAVAICGIRISDMYGYQPI